MSKPLIPKKKIIYNRLIIIVLVAFCLLFTKSANAQVNLKIGYNLNYSSFHTHNMLFEEFNIANPWLAQEFKDLKILNGLQMGARFRGEFMGVDLTWERSSASRSARGIDPTDLNFDKEFDYTMNRVGFGLETYSKFVGIGANIYWEKFNISSPIAALESEQNIFKGDRFGNKVYLILSAPGSERLSISLQPYLAIPWSHHNLAPFARDLNVSAKNGWIQENMHFGFSIVFYNGPQQ